MNVKNRLMFLALLVGVTGGCFLFFSGSASRFNPSEEVAEVTVAGSGLASAASEPALVQSNSNDPQIFEKTKRAALIVDKWFKGSGYTPDGVKNYTESYSESELVAMADEGDVVAIEALIPLIRKRGSRADTELIIEKGVVYGSLNALNSAVTHYASGVTPYSYGVDASRDRLLSAMANARLMEEQGVADLYGVGGDISRTIERYLGAAGIDQLPQSFYEDLDLRYASIVGRYEAKRQELGLNNGFQSVPDEVKALSERIRQVRLSR